MNGHDKTWESARDSYLGQVKEALAAAKYPGSKSILDEVRQHLEQRYAELSPERRSWESYQAIIGEMGPPSDYVDLLGVAKLKHRLVTWRRIAILVPLALVMLMVGNFFGIIPLTFYHGPRVFYLPGAPTEPPYVEDAKIIGQWQTVGLTDSPSHFVPGGKWVERRGWLKALSFRQDGTLEAAMSGTDYPRWDWASRCKWTKDWILDNKNKIQAQYVIRETGGDQYLFYPWISGDIMYRWMRPAYYVMKKVSDIPAPVTHGDKAVKFNKSSGVIPGFDINTATLDDVIRVFGEPQKYVSGNDEVARDKLPRYYIAVYPNDFSVHMSDDKVLEIRHEGEDGYVFAGKVKIGSTLEEVIAALGEPKETVVGEAVGLVDGVLYKDVNGRTGKCCYVRSDKNVRLYLADYKVEAIYVTRSDVGGRDASNGQ